MKNTVYAIIIVVCFVAAAVIAYKYIFTSDTGGGIEDISPEEMMWVKCNNPNCKAEYEMGKKNFFKQIEKKMQANPMAAMGMTPPLVCKECDKESVLKAEKCQNPDCGIVFLYGSVPNDFGDRCPECGRSETEESRERRKAVGGAG